MMPTNLQIDDSAEISAAAKRARDRYERTMGDGLLEHAVNNWKLSVEPFFRAFIAAVKDAQRPVPGAYFDPGMAFPENPIFAFPYSKAIHCILSDLESGRFGRADVERLMRDVLTPYVDRWRELLAALETRFGCHAQIAAFKRTLSALFDKVYSLQFGRQGQSFFDDYNNSYTIFRNGFGELREAIASSLQLASAGALTVRESERPRYPQDAEAVMVLREALRRKGEARYRDYSNRAIMEKMAGELTYKLRMLQGRDLGNGRRKYAAAPRTVAAAANQWGKHLSEYARAHASS